MEEWSLPEDESTLELKTADDTPAMGLDLKYLAPTEGNKSLTPFTPLEDILGSSIASSSSNPPKELNLDEISFDQGALSGRSTSISGSLDKTCTFDEKFDDFSEFKSTNNGFDDIDFGEVASDNLALIDADEREFGKETTFDIPPAEVTNVGSMTHVFTSNTSRLGSLEFRSTEELRPNLGFGRISSPEREPVKVVQEKDVKSRESFINSFKKQIYEKNKIKSNDTYIVIEEIPSFLEVSQNVTSSAVPEIKINNETIHKDNEDVFKKPAAIKFTNPNSTRKSLSDTINRKVRRSSPIKLPKKSEPNVLVKKEVENLACAMNNNAVRTNDNVEIPVRNEVKNAAPSQFDPNRFPIVSNRSILNYIAVGINEVQEEVLCFKNIMNREISVNVAIKDCFEVILHIPVLNSQNSKDRLYLYSFASKNVYTVWILLLNLMDPNLFLYFSPRHQARRFLEL